MALPSETKLVNNTILDYLDTPGMQKKAVDAINDYTRFKMREDGILRRILPPLPISNDDLDRDVSTDKPVKIVDKEPDSPAAVTLPFNDLPMNFYIKAPKFRVLFSRISTPQFTKDKEELRTYHMDIRQVFSDNAIKDLLAEEDNTLFSAVNTFLVGQNSVLATSGIAQWVTIPGGIIRDTMEDAFKILPSTPSHLEVNSVVINNVTIREILKWRRDEVGGDLSQDLLKNGWREAEFMNAHWYVTIKRNLVPDDSIFMFADPQFLGKLYTLEDATIFIKLDLWWVSFLAAQVLGAALSNSNAIARVDFT